MVFIFRLNLKTEKSLYFFDTKLHYVYLNSFTIFNASCDFASEKVFIMKNITSKQIKNKQTKTKKMKQIQNLREM